MHLSDWQVKRLYPRPLEPPVYEAAHFVLESAAPKISTFTPVPKRIGGAFFGPSWKANGQFYMRIGPRGSLPLVPSLDLGGLKNR